MKSENPDYRVDEDAILRARPKWISPEENRDMVQNEIMLESSSKWSQFALGRSDRCDISLKIKAVSS